MKRSGWCGRAPSMTKRLVLAVALTVAVIGSSLSTAVSAAEWDPSNPKRPAQPVLMSMKDLLTHLDPNKEWQFVPLADFERMVAAARAEQQHHTEREPAVIPQQLSVAESRLHLTGGWLIGSARIAVVSTIAGQKIEIPFAPVAAADAASATHTIAFGLTRLDGEPAFFSTPDFIPGTIVSGTLIVPQPGAHVFTGSWAVPVVNNQRIPLIRPALPGWCDLTSDRVGQWSGPGLYRDGERTRVIAYRNTVGNQGFQYAAWTDRGPGGPAVWGVNQALTLSQRDGVVEGAWKLQFTAHNQALPNAVSISVPAGWTVVPPPPDALPRVDTSGEGLVRISPVTAVTLRVFMSPAAVIDAPRCHGAVHAGMEVTVGAGLRVQPGSGWRAAGERWLIAGPATAAAVAGRWELTTPVRPARQQRSARLLGRRDGWSVGESITIIAGDVPLTRCTIDIADGWRAEYLDAPGWRLEGAATVDELPPGAALNLVALSPVPPGQQCEITLTTTSTPVGDMTPSVGRTVRQLQPTDSASAAQTVWRPARVRAAFSAGLRAVVRWDAPVTPALSATGWLINESHIDSMTLDGDGPILLSIQPAAVHARGEAVIHLLPTATVGGDNGTWARVDLRVVLHTGTPTPITLHGLGLSASSAHLSAPGWGLRAASDAYVHANTDAGTTDPRAIELLPPNDWRGEQLLRIEGPWSGPAPQELTAHMALQTLAWRTWIALQAGDRADLDRLGATGLDADDLPTWSRPIPGAGIVRVWDPVMNGDPRLRTWTVIQRDLATVPTGVIASANARLQIGTTAATLWWSCQLAAPGVDAVAVRLPAGATLISAHIDGEPARVRAGSPPRLVLPGRTNCAVVLVLSVPVPQAGLYAVTAPMFDAVPVAHTTWNVAVDGLWHATPVSAPTAVALMPPAFLRPWLSSWPAAAVRFDQAQQAAPTVSTRTDPRRLVADQAAPMAAAPSMDLVGEQFHGRRAGAPAVQLYLSERDGLRRDDRHGWITAVLIGLLLAWRLPQRTALILSVAAFFAALALRGFIIIHGPWLAGAELLPFVIIAGVIARTVFGQRTPPASPSSIATHAEQELSKP